MDCVNSGSLRVLDATEIYFRNGHQVLRGTLGELAEHAARTDVLGEIVILVAGAHAVAADPADLAAQVLARAEAGERLKDAAKDVARAHSGVSASELYDLARGMRG